MKPLTQTIDAGEFDGMVESFRCQDTKKADAAEARGKLADKGYRFRMLDPKGGEASLLAADSSSASKETRYNALWVAHAVAVSAIFDGGSHPDAYVGHSSQPYADIRYVNYLEIGEVVPYGDVDVRCGLMRVAFEFESILKARRENHRQGYAADYTLVDGSLHTTARSLATEADYPEKKRAEDAYSGVVGGGKVVGMVEDSHATDVSGALGYSFTNMALFDVALKPGEYAASPAAGLTVCHIKLPKKMLPHLPSGESEPLTVRWEFNWDAFEDDLNLLAWMWLMEDDLLHPQLYPLRLADHLTRRIKVAGVLGRIAEKNGLQPKYRELREG